MKLFTRGFVLILLLPLLHTAGYAQLSANFTADVTAGCSPLVVHFTNTTTPMSGTTFDWNLGLGGTDPTSVDASSSYITPGTYTITLTARNGGATSRHTMTITVYPSPTVSFTANRTAICPGSSVTFTSTTTGGVPGPVTCTWNFGDGFSGTGSPVTHTYASPGVYNVTLSAQNADGCVSSLTMPSYILVYNPANVNFGINNNYFCKAPGHAVFNNLTSGTSPFSYTWRFGDGSSPSSSIDPTHDYTSPGTYTVTLVVTDGNGCIDSLVMPGDVFVGNLHAAFTGPATACVGSLVTFTDGSSAHTTATWSFGDGNSSLGDPGLNTYGTPGTYNVTLVVYDGHCYDTVTHPITILPGPTASFSVTPTEPCPPPGNLTFHSSVPTGTSVTWLVNGVLAGSGTTVVHPYSAGGIDTIKMISVDPSTGCKDTVMRYDTIYDLQFHILNLPHSGCKPLTVNFSTTALTNIPAPGGPYPYPYPFSTYTWTFGDGSPTAGGATPSHTYTAVGTYLARVTAVTSNGCTVQDSVVIEVGTPPVVTFTYTPAHECYHDNMITFNITVVSGPVDTFYWIFDDGTGAGPTSSLTETHHYGYPGVFGATVIPMYHGCAGPPFGLSHIITLDSPMSVIDDTFRCTPRTRVAFANLSIGATSFMWDFKDVPGDTTSLVSNPVHNFPADTIYTVYLYTYNVRSGCRDTANAIINLIPPVVTISAPDTAICRDSFVTLTATLVSGYLDQYRWHSGGWSNDSLGTFTYIDTFHTRGIYPISFIFDDQIRCVDTVTRNNYIHVAKPVASFTASPPSGCWPLAVTYTDASNDIPGTFFTRYVWSFGDGGTSTVTTSSVRHTYYSAGTFMAKEIVTDNIGCKDTDSVALVTVYRPHATFTASSLNICVWDSTQFLNASTGIVSSFWMFGDGGTSTLNSPWHTYTARGTYTVKLVVTDSHGCTDTATQVAYINVMRPTAAFNMSDSASVCPPLLVTFNNTSTGGIFYNWWLGDGSMSSAFSPSDLYTHTGVDTVTLIVSNSYGCRDTAYGHVTIFGYAGEFSYGPSDTGCSPMLVRFRATTLNVPNIIWDFADGNVSRVSYSDSITHIYTQPGAFVPKLILSDNSGCQNSSIGADTIKVDLVTADFPTHPVCIGDTFALADSSTSFWSTITGWSWSVDGLSSTASSPSFLINTTGSYPATLTVTDGWGCTATVTHDINVVPLPVITASKDTVVCAGDPAVLYGYGGTKYSWSPPATLSCTTCNPAIAKPDVATTYTVTGTDANGCSNTDTTTVNLRTNTVANAWGDTAICYGTTVPLFDTGGTKYTWIPGIGLNSAAVSNPMATPGSTTKYMAIAQLAGCIPDTNYVTVVVHQLPSVNAGPDQTLLAGSTAQLDATGTLISRYLWNNTGTLSCDTCPSPVASMQFTTTYIVNVFSDFGCTNSDSVTIHIYCDNSQMFIPNSFTPNHDGQNDVFYPRGIGVSIIKSFRIYNRWGELMFERSNIAINDASNAWDGSFEGGTPRPDVYVWIIDAECEAGQELHLKGDVTIIR